MKYLILFGVLFSCFFCVNAQTEKENLALCLDGKDNCVCIGMGIIEAPWTVEAWVKGNDSDWKESEVVIGGGEYSILSYADNNPLQIKNGKLHSTKAGLWSSSVMDDKWHHVAVSCDGKTTRLFLDGKVVDQKEISMAILPGTIGTDNSPETTFGGLIDEVRIWTDAISESTLKEWMNAPLRASHPDIKKLKGYYPFDEVLEESSVNWVGKGYQPYHIRNYRYEYKEELPLAHTDINDNQSFGKEDFPQEVFNAIVIESEWDVDQGSKDNQFLKIRIAVRGTNKPLKVNELTLDLSGTTSLQDISDIHVYYTGSKAKSGIKAELFGTGIKPQQKIVLKAKKEAIELKPGINYLLITANIKPDAGIGNVVNIKVPSLKLNGKKYLPETSEGMQKKQIKSRQGYNLRVLQWNIWHGGVRVGNTKADRVIELIKVANPDIVTIQEGYGSQEKIAEATGLFLQTPSPKDNLVLLSRYKMEKLPTKKTFYSNPAKITLPNGREILVNSSWLHYAYRPAYTGDFPEKGLDTEVWVKEDSILALANIRHTIEEDINPVKSDENMAVIIGGDFNSFSHLDWTKAAAPLHYGYGPVDFPVSRFMYENGYKDSFREVNPDEVSRPEGTYANIFGHLYNSRIDFIYYSGKGIKPVFSKIIRTAPEIDDVWVSDHEAVITDFEVEPN
ncbi:MAG: endonuclease/exonuclease/phosphatase family protein [Prevotella sp.]|jgi:endonuclease/exonuclease/phosphatase (EEP) superfamily protein YafD|nr:endonuclease/exonuclease/phosphatase family protein [Prevotella sp.]